MKRIYQSQFKEHIVKYFNLRLARGMIIKNNEVTLAKFDEFARQDFPKLKKITRFMFTAFMDRYKHLKSITRNKLASDLRQFCLFMLQYKPSTYIPETFLYPRPIRFVEPYIFSMDDVWRLMTIASMLGPRGSLRPHTYRTLIGLLWATGMRVGETLNLNVEDYDIGNKIIHVKQTKFYKSRFVPVSLPTGEALDEYLSLRETFLGAIDNTLPLFCNEDGVQLPYDTVRCAFRDLFHKFGVQNRQGRYPRIIDFRHTFATLCLEKIQRNLEDPNSYLPVLATYMGHACISMTQTYLHPSQEILGHSGERFQQYIQNNAKPLEQGAL